MTDSTPGTEAGKPRGDWPFGQTTGGAPVPNPAAPVAARTLPSPRTNLGGPAAGGAHASEPDPGPVLPPTDEAAAEPATPGSRRRLILISSIVAGVVILGVIGAALAGVFDGTDPIAAPSPSTVTLASPTPTIDPIARQPISAFADALPSSVLAYALTAVTDYPPLVASGALEAHQLSFSDGGAVALTLYGGQFETAPEATAAYTALLATATAAGGGAATPAPSASSAEPTSGTVEVAGQPVGAWAVTTAADGSGSALWTNGTALFQVVGPPKAVADFYQAFPL